MDYTNELTEILREAEQLNLENGKMKFYIDTYTEIGAFGVHNEITNLYLLISQDGEIIKREHIKSKFDDFTGAMKERTLNYMLYQKGLYHWKGYGLPSDQQTYNREIKSLKHTYDRMIEGGFITSQI